MTDTVIIKDASREAVLVKDGSQYVVLMGGGRGPSGTAGLQGPAGDLAKAANRAALAAIAGAAGLTRYLIEAGREGTFVFDAANHSAHVTADTAQGLYVAPASDATGGSGAWVRKYDGAVKPDWFGIVRGDVAGANAAANNAAWTTLAATLAALAVNNTSNRQGVPDLEFGIGNYEFSSPLDLNFGSLRLTGRGSGKDGGPITRLAFYNSTGIRFQSTDTSSGATKDGVAHLGSGKSVLRDLAIEGNYTDTEAEYHGIHARARVHIENVQVRFFAGDGIRFEGSTGAVGGTVDSSVLIGAQVDSNRNGVRMVGNDANVITVAGVSANSNRQWNFYDQGSFGNSYSGCECATGGLTDGHSPPSMVSFAGNLYFVINGQNVGASTNAPSGDTTDNTWWAYKGAGGVTATHPAWVNGTTYRAGGSMCTEGLSQYSVFDCCYAESDQPLAQISRPARVINGFLSTNVWQGSTGYVETVPTSDRTINSNGPYIVKGYTGTDEVVSAGLGGNNNIKTILSANGSVTAPSVFRLKFSGDELLFDYGNLAAAQAYWITGPNTAQAFGSGTPQPYSFYAPSLVVGPINPNGGIANARRLMMDTAAPASGAHGIGEFVFDRTNAVDGRLGWKCTVNGTPGTWAAFYGGYGIGPIGYATGAGNALVQATSKSTGVTMNKLCGQITMNAAALAAAAVVEFTVTNSQVALTDTINLNLQGGAATSTAYRYWISGVAAGSFKVCVENRSAASLSEAIKFNFAVVKAVSA